MLVLQRIFVAFFFLSLASTTLADETKPILVVSLKGQQHLIDDLEYIGSTRAFQEHDREKQGQKFVDSIVNRFMRKLLEIEKFDLRELPGIDMERPWGFTVLTDEVNIVPLAFLPVTDLDAFLEYAKEFSADRVQEAEGGLYEINMTDTETVFIKLEGDWVFIGQGPDNLVSLPNPEELLGDLPLRYDLGVQINFQEIPAFLRDMVLDSSDRLMELLPLDSLQGLTGMLGDDPGKMLNLMLTQIDQVTIGSSIDAESHNATFEVTVRPLDDSAAQRHFATLPEATTRFGVLVNPDSAIMAHVTIAEMDDRTTQLAMKTVNDYHQQVMTAIEATEEVTTDREREVFVELVTSFTEITTAAIETGSVDMAVRVTGNSGSMTMVAATTVADREPVDALVGRIAELAQGDPGFEKIELEVTEQDGVAIHAFKLAANAEGEVASAGTGIMKTLFGDAMEIYVAVGEDTFFLAVGAEGLEQLKAAMKMEEKLVSPMEMVMDFKPVIDLLGGLAGDNQQIKVVMGVLRMQLISIDSHVTLSLNPSSDGIVLRGEAREGILKLMAVAFPLLQNTILEQLKAGGGPLGLPSVPGL